MLVLERNLRIIDEAIREARTALDADPANALLNAHLASARQRKLNLLRRAAPHHRRRLMLMPPRLPALTCAAVLLAAAPALAAGQNAAAQAQAPVQARPADRKPRRPAPDQTVDVARGTQLVLSSQAGEATVRAWDRDAVRVQANHSPREQVEVQTADNTVRVRARTASGTRGPAGLVDYVITVPRWMPVSLSGTYLATTSKAPARR